MYKERISAILEANKDDPDILDFVESRVNTFTDYVSYVNFEEVRIQRMQIEGIKGEQWRDAVESLDNHRRSKHDVCLNAINQLNRLAESSGLKPFYEKPVDHEHRTEVGDVIGEIVNEYFKGRDPHPLTIRNMMDGDKDFANAVEALNSNDNELKQ